MTEPSQAIRVDTHQNYGTMDQIPAQGMFGVIPPQGMAQTPGPCAPTMFDGNGVSGYEGTIGGDCEGKYFPPPPDTIPGHGGKPEPALINWNIPAISEEVARDAFVEYAQSKCCYRRSPAQEMIFHDLQSFNTYRYRLETFTESRSSVWKTEPFSGGAVDCYAYGAAPLPWDVRVEVPDLFKDTITKIKVPHTSSVKGCPICGCSGRIACNTCHGSTKQQCWVCNGRGYRFSNDRCTRCNGAGMARCDGCSGMGTKACQNCAGKGQLLSYIELQIEWKNNIFEHVVDQRSGFPTELFREVNGQKLFVDEQHMVYPVMSFPDCAVNQASRNAVEQHQTKFASTSRILRQRQTIELIFLTNVEYEWGGKSYSYFVYGNEHKVYAKDYPGKCCCCTIM